MNVNVTKILKGVSIGIGGAGLIIGSLLSERQMDESVARYMEKKEKKEKEEEESE